ncbi:MAG: hypothetical protein OXI22_00845 [Defluviicoccus sp.]|nr:hypothetical protein [Defluviicoccus sp.]
MRISCSPEWPSATPTNLVGACQAQGHPLRVFVERPPAPEDPGPLPEDRRAWLTVRFEGVEAGIPPPAAFGGVTEIDLAGTVWPVLPRVLKCDNHVLQGSIPAADADGVFEQALQAQPPARPAHEAPGPEGAQRDAGPGAPADPPPAPPPASADTLDAKIAAYQAAKGALAEGRQKLVAMQRIERGLRQKHEEATEDRTEAESALERLRAAAADARRQLLDAVDREED